MNKQKIIILLIIFAVFVLIVPIIINESYKSNSGYITLWRANDLLLYFGSVISAIGTIFIGIIAFVQNNRSNDINDRLLKLQEVNSTPFLHLDITGCKIQCFRDREIDILIGLRNETHNVINIIEVSHMKVDKLLLKRIPFCKDWTTHYSVLPHQTKQINFFEEVKVDDAHLVEHSINFFHGDFIQLICSIEIKLHSVNSTDIYIQKIEFFLNVCLPEKSDSKYKVNIFNIENSIEREGSIC